MIQYNCTKIVKSILLSIALSFSLFSIQAVAKDIQKQLSPQNLEIIQDRFGTTLVLPVDKAFTEPGSAVIEPTFYETLNKVAQVIKTYPEATITISGHTDDILGKKRQQEISQAHAVSISNYLVQRGVDANRIISVRGEGERFAVAKNDHYSNRAKNRRVEVNLHAFIN